jgi:DNA-nicking Smr family endonuclease
MARLSDEDKKLWKASVAIITPHKKTDTHKKKRNYRANTDADDSAQPRTPTTKPTTKHAIKKKWETLGHTPIPGNPTLKNIPVQGDVPPLKPDIMASIKTKKRVIDARIDLHGMTQDMAHKHLLSFIRKSHADGLRMLLVITGKGRLSEGTLKKNLPRWLAADASCAAIISGISTAQAQHGGAGAFYVMLKKR